MGYVRMWMVDGSVGHSVSTGPARGVDGLGGHGSGAWVMDG